MVERTGWIGIGSVVVATGIGIGGTFNLTGYSKSVKVKNPDTVT